jgi:hypothetical protein
METLGVAVDLRTRIMDHHHVDVRLTESAKFWVFFGASVFDVSEASGGFWEQRINSPTWWNRQ